jgi:hypothetical protein
MMGIRSSEQTSVGDFDDPYCYYYAGNILVLLNNLYQMIKKLVTLERADCVFLDLHATTTIYRSLMIVKYF